MAVESRSAHRSLTFAQTQNMPAAIDIVMRTVGEATRKRSEVARVVVALAVQHDYESQRLADLAMTQLGLPLASSMPADARLPDPDQLQDQDR
jgi:hypothetical protein